MKIAIATDGTQVANHFGRCQSYTIVEIENNEILKKSIIDNPGHEPGFLPKFLSEKGVNCILAGGMGPRAINLFEEKNVEAIVGVHGSIDKVIEDFLNHNIEVGDSKCSHEIRDPKRN